MAAASTLEAPALPVRILDLPRWRIHIRPIEYVEDRIGSRSECWNIVEAAVVRSAGWEYPFIHRDNRANGDSWISSWVDADGHVEYWRLFQSGQFVHHVSFREDGCDLREIAARRVNEEFRGSLLANPPAGFVDPFLTLRRVTNAYEFAARLAAKGVLGDAAAITISMHNVRGRALCALDWNRMWGGDFRAQDDTLSPRPFAVTVEQLLADPRSPALDTAIWLFESFGWNDPSRAQLQADQAAMLVRP